MPAPGAGRAVRQTVTVAQALRRGVLQLEAAGRARAAMDARLLLAEAAGRDAVWVLAHPGAGMEPAVLERYLGWVEQRAAGVPVAYLLGRREFFGRDFCVTPGVLIPRPETELLVEAALRRLGLRAGVAADVGTGSGCIAVTLALEMPALRVLASDLSAGALEVAGTNARRHGVAARVALVRADLLPARPGSLDAVLSNPPYVAPGDPQLQQEVWAHEPALALFGGRDGLEVYRRLIPAAAGWLRPGGWLILEMGAGAAPQVSAMLRADVWEAPESIPDLQGIPRCLAARRQPGGQASARPPSTWR